MDGPLTYRPNACRPRNSRIDGAALPLLRRKSNLSRTRVRQEHDIPEEVIAHVHNLRMIGSIGSKVSMTVFDPVLEEREAHRRSILALLPKFARERCIVFLDPDGGLEAPKDKDAS